MPRLCVFSLRSSSISESLHVRASGSCSILDLSPAFADGANIPAKFTCATGPQNPSPALSWTDAPANAKSFVLILTIPTPRSRVGSAHWVSTDIPATTTSLPEAFQPGSVGVSGNSGFRRLGLRRTMPAVGRAPLPFQARRSRCADARPPWPGPRKPTSKRRWKATSSAPPRPLGCISASRSSDAALGAVECDSTSTAPGLPLRTNASRKESVNAIAHRVIASIRPPRRDRGATEWDKSVTAKKRDTMK